MPAAKRPTTQSVKGRTATPRTPGDPDPDSSDSPNNAGRPGSNVTTEELANQVAAAEAVVRSPSVRQQKATMPLRGAKDEHQAALEARVAEAEATMTEMKEQMRGVMEANRNLLAAQRRNAPDMPKATELPELDAALQRKHDRGELDGPVQTKQGWLVPRVTTANPEQQTAAALITELRKGVGSTRATTLADEEDAAPAKKFAKSGA